MPTNSNDNLDTERSHVADRSEGPTRDLYEKLGKIRDAMGAIVVPYAPQQEFRAAIEELSATARHSRGRPQPGVHLFAPSYSGKTMGIIEVANAINGSGGEEFGSIPIAVARLDPEASVGSVATDMLKALKEPRPERGTAAVRWERVLDAIQRRKVEVFIFDEWQRLGRRPTVSPGIAGKIQDIMDAGLCAAAFVGKADGINIFRAYPDLQNRLDTPVTMPPLQWLRDDDRHLFIKFVRSYETALIAQGIVKFSCEMADESVAQPLLEASCGLIGYFCQIVQSAVISITRDDHDGITYEDLTRAVDEWGIGNNRIDYNPLRAVPQT